MGRSSNHRVRFVLALALLTGARAGQACASAPDAATAPDAESAARRALGVSIWRVALMDLRATGNPTPRDYSIAAAQLGHAARYLPGDAELARQWSEATWNAGDADQLQSATSRLVTLDARDTVAQLRLLGTRFARLHTADEKIAAYDRIWGEEGARAGLDVGIRGRFALDAALLSRESGDERGFVQRLGRALDLDATNKDAALLGLSYYEQRLDDRVGLVDWLTNLLLADPADPQVHLRLAREFAAGGAMEAASRFHRNAIALLTAGDRGATVEQAIESRVLKVMLRGPKELFDSLNAQLRTAREACAAERAAREAAHQDLSGLTKPEELRLDMDSEPMRLVTALMLGEDAAAKASVGEMALTADEDAVAYMDPLRRPAGMGEDEARDRGNSEILDAQLWRLVVGEQVDKVPEKMQQIGDAIPADDDRMIAARAMFLARTGHGAEAMAELDHAGDLGQWGLVAKAISLAVSGEFEGAVRALGAAHRVAPLSPLGLYVWHSRGVIMRAHSIPEPPEDAAQRTRLERADRAIGSWIDQVARDPRSFQSLAIRVDAAEAEALDTVGTTVVLRNITRVPLGLGAGRPINSRLLLAPALVAGSYSATSLASSEVIDLERRVRLGPGEAIEARVSPETGPLGYLIETLSVVQTQIRWRVVQGFEVRSNGAREPGPACLETMSTTLTRRPLLESRLPVPELASRLDSASLADLPRLLVAARSVLVMNSPIHTAPLVEAIVRLYGRTPAPGRALVLASLPPATELSELQALDAAAAQETDPEVLWVAIPTRCTAPDSPLLAAGKASGDPGLVALAEAQTQRLGEDGSCFAKGGSGIAAPIRKLFNVPDTLASPASTQAPLPKK